MSRYVFVRLLIYVFSYLSVYLSIYINEYTIYLILTSMSIVHVYILLPVVMLHSRVAKKKVGFFCFVFVFVFFLFCFVCCCLGGGGVCLFVCFHCLRAHHFRHHRITITIGIIVISIMITRRGPVERFP